ncbi:RnfH family protein [uncultured Amphritea sp.]|uniref:RnfH family protein n=1 Tax=Amphritea sp. TaxID=1872502 RepID=UPI002625C3B9|nr:RnfH family protein [uncultured Amphritea sp.]
MKVSIAYAGENKQLWSNIEIDDSATVETAIAASQILEQCPEINLKTQKIGIFGKLTRLNAPLAEGDRIEIYRKIIRVFDEDDDDDDDD